MLDDDFHYQVTDLYNDWAPLFAWNTSCSMGVTLFPFDELQCKRFLMNCMNTAKVVSFVLVDDNSLDVRDYIPSSNWKLRSASVGSTLLVDSFQSYPMVWFALQLKRVSIYFICNIILPAVCLSILACLVFLLRAESGEKMGLSVIVLMSFSVFLLMISDYVPRAAKLPIFSEFTVNTLSYRV